MSALQEPDHNPKLESVPEEDGSGSVQERAADDKHTKDKAETGGVRGPGMQRRKTTKENIPWTCEKCSKLGLSVDKFLINNRSMSAVRQSIQGGSHSIFSPKSANRRYPLGTYRAISSRRKSVANPDDGGNEHKTEDQLNAMCFLSWEIDGRSVGQYEGTVKARTRRIHLQWQAGLLEDAYLVLVTPNQYKMIYSDARNIWQADSHFLARKISKDASRATLVKSWLDECLKSHRRDCVHSRDDRKAFSAVNGQSYFGVIDVEQMCLTALPPKRSTASGDISSRSEDDDGGREEDQHMPYVALSYVWGGQNAELTVHENVLTRLFPGGLEEPLKRMPTVIRDAIELVRRLGFRYLWIDSICIVQNSNRSWKLNADVMDIIYGNAELTICAADGQDACTGLKALNKPSSTQIIAECAPGVRLMVSRLVEASIRKSKRCLIFTEGRVFFQCRSATMSEDIVTSPESADMSSGWSLDLVQSPLKLLDSLRWRPIWFYMNCIPLYSSRDLTKSGDIIAAFNGVANHIENALDSPLIFGLPSSHFDLALLWIPMGVAERREREGKEGSEQKGVYQRREQEFPSWSWCGWRGATMDYLANSMIDDCLVDVQDWLMTHTWIKWYIRDGRGRLRPLWSSADAPKDHNSTKRWRGYKSGPWSGDDDDSESERRRRQRRAYRLAQHEREVYGSIYPTKPEYDELPADYAHDRYRDRTQFSANNPFRTTRKDAEFEVSNVPLRPRPSWEAYDDYPLPRRPINPYNDVNPYSTVKLPPPPPARAVSMRRGFSPPPSVRDYQSASLPPPPPGRYNRDDNPDHLRDAQGRDSYGRTLPAHARDEMHKTQPFSRTIPESPYKVNMTRYARKKDKEYPDLPILQFWTHSAYLRLHPFEEDSTWHRLASHGGHGLVRFNIADVSGDWCGSVLLSSAWVEREEDRPGHSWEDERYEFLALSEAKRFTEEECAAWTYYMPVERKQSEWHLYFVLLVEKRNGTWSRVALGKVFQTAFENGLGGGPSTWKEIVLV
ncbi:heterokaryon incompatibility protein-domain-containing protein [Macrophomina phaseolina]|uniref:Heterokaryon incompatibility protein-domain-containing protein n=1 Tax=Macrophomina phaseolina TaxID=35725 RepID=A0ABQ8G3H4_9PEZI|nr:heterokaryon incompatibility protein-domain-containing protein [Macrophomina phaseolina]